MHHTNGKPNAFRHALWNILICKQIFRISKNQEKSLVWTKKITDLHEKIAPNEPLETAMDLQNNKAGRCYFRELKNASDEEIVCFLEDKLTNAKVIHEIHHIDNDYNDLVYLLEENNE